MILVHCHISHDDYTLSENQNKIEPAKKSNKVVRWDNYNSTNSNNTSPL